MFWNGLGLVITKIAMNQRWWRIPKFNLNYIEIIYINSLYKLCVSNVFIHKIKIKLSYFQDCMCKTVCCCRCSVAKLCLTLCDSRACSRPVFPVPHYLGVSSHSCPLSQWYYLAISSSASLFSFCLQTFPASGPFPMSWPFLSGGQYLKYWQNFLADSLYSFRVSSLLFLTEWRVQTLIHKSRYVRNTK